MISRAAFLFYINSLFLNSSGVASECNEFPGGVL